MKANLPASLPFRLECWSADGRHLEETLLAASNVLLARAAFEKAAVLWPQRRLMLCNLAQVIAEHRPAVRPADLPSGRPIDGIAGF